MLTRLADLGIRAPKRVLGLAGLLLVLAALYGASAASHLSAGGFRAPHAASTKADTILATTFKAGAPNLVLEITAPDGVTSAAARAAGLQAVRTVQTFGYASQVMSYWTAPSDAATALRSKDGRSGLVVAVVAGSDSVAPQRAATITSAVRHDAAASLRAGVTIAAGGQAIVFDQVNTHTKSDLAVAEGIAIPLTMIALTWVFGSLVAALLPLAVGLTSIIGTMALLRGLATVTDVSIYALNMTTAMGLALAIDYSLFIVSRYREELRRGATSAEAVRITMRTAGRTVLFSALTVGLSLAAMLVFPVFFLRSFAYAGLAVVALATVAALVLLPALLTLLQHRIELLDLRAGVRRMLGRPAPAAPIAVEQSFWYRFATRVMKRAVPVGLTVTAVLIALGLPFAHAHFAYPDDRVLPTSASAHQVGNDLRAQYDANAASTMTIVIPDTSAAPNGIAAYATRLSTVPGVAAVTASTGVYADGRVAGPAVAGHQSGHVSYLSLATTVDPVGPAGRTLLNRVEAVPAPWAVLLGGYTAVNRDSLAALGAALPYALGLIALATFVVLFLFTGSVVLPLKALLLNTLSLSATFGAMVWIFQEGHLHALYPQLTTTGYLVPTMPPLMFCLAFGLSMDYEVFLLSRIRESWLESGRTSADNGHAVALGLGRTGRIVTAAALLMAIVFAPMAFGSVAFMMLFGTGLTLAVIMDATLVRGVLVPAFMQLAGRWNWWAPRPLTRLHERFGLSEGPSSPAASEPELVGSVA